MKQCDFQHFIAPEAVGFSRNQIDFAVEPFNDTLRILLIGLEPVHDQRLMPAQRTHKLFDRLRRSPILPASILYLDRLAKPGR